MTPVAGRIVRTTAFTVALGFTEPELSSKGRRLGFDNVLVRVETEEGAVGWGEASGGTTGAPVQAVRAVVDKVAPLVQGLSVFETGRLRQTIMVGGRLSNVTRLGHLACAAYDTACWDAAGRLAGLSVSQMLGGAVRDSVDVFGYSMKHDPEAVVADAIESVAAGHSVLYVKVGVDAHRDLETVAAVRDAVGAGVRLRADANEAWSLPMARRMLRRLEEFDLDFVEAPVDARNLSAMRELRASTSIPIAANEGMWSLREAAEAIRQGACDVVVVGPLWLGGLIVLQQLAAMCEAHDVGYCLHAPPASSIASAAALQVLATVPRLEDGNQSYYPRHLEDDVADGLGVIEDGGLAVPRGPGLGIDVDESRVAAFAERHARDGGFAQRVPERR